MSYGSDEGSDEYNTKNKKKPYREVIDMVITEYDEKKTMVAIAREEFEEGRLQTLINLVRKGLLSAADAAKELSISEKKFMSML